MNAVDPSLQASQTLRTTRRRDAYLAFRVARWVTIYEHTKTEWIGQRAHGLPLEPCPRYHHNLNATWDLIHHANRHGLLTPELLTELITIVITLPEYEAAPRVAGIIYDLVDPKEAEPGAAELEPEEEETNHP